MVTCDQSRAVYIRPVPRRQGFLWIYSHRELLLYRINQFSTGLELNDFLGRCAHGLA